MSRDKIALVLAGGGITGAVYEIGALRAIEDMLVGHTINDFDIFVGTSAGALVCALIANGFSPNEIMQLIDDRHPEIRGVKVGDIFQSNLDGLSRRLLRLPKTLVNVGFNSVRHLRDVALSDIFWEFAQILPTGLYNGDALERYLCALLTEVGAVNRFDQLKKELYIVATELETGKRAVFGQGGKAIVPISQAVAASSAVPVLYRPVKIYHRDYVDGGLHGSASIDLAIESGAKLVVCINPMVPLDTTGLADKEHYVRERGIQAIINQSVRTLMHAGVRYHIKNLSVKYPDVDIILIQPQPDDYRMFSFNPMYYGSRLTVAEHGFETVTVGLMENAEYFRQVLARHDIELRTDKVARELDSIRASGDDPDVVQQVIEGRAESPKLNAAMEQLENSLKQLHATIEMT
jgi:NTE family protein